MNFCEKNNISADANQLGKDVLELCKSFLLMKTKYLGRAIYALELECSEKTNSFATNGISLYFNASYVLDLFQNNKKKLNRIYIHTLFHCIFRHFDTNADINQKIWNLACDIAVEHILMELHIEEINDNMTHQQQYILAALSNEIDVPTAEKIYHFIINNMENTDGIHAKYALATEILEHEKLFLQDDHSLWYVPEQMKSKENQTSMEETYDATIFEDLSLTDESQLRVLPKVELAEKWKEIAHIVKLELEIDSSNKGQNAGGLSQKIAIANRDQVNYSQFIKKFATYHESMKINHDDFDYIYYTYGMQLFENMPLIEPLEYKEDKNIQGFVIAIDTSGSVSQKRIVRFLESTYGILNQIELFFHKSKIYIMQCDAKIQDVCLIQNQNDFMSYIHNFTAYGFGGTDFSPVFQYAEELLAKKELSQINGLLYFTDGLGTFPQKAPSFPVAFILTEDCDYNFNNIPNWAMKVILSETDLECKNNKN